MLPDPGGLADSPFTLVEFPETGYEAVVLVVSGCLADWDWHVELLESEGYRVEQSASADDGLARAIDLRPDLILADLDGETGFVEGRKFLTALRHSRGAADIPFVLVTRVFQGSVIREAMDTGADDFLIKPLQGSTVVSSVRARIRRHRATARQALSGCEESFEAFSSKVLESIARGAAVSSILQIVGKRISGHARAKLVTCAIAHLDKLESVDAEGIPARHWRRFDDLLAVLPESGKPVPIGPELDEFLRSRCFPLDEAGFPSQVWRLPIRNPEGLLLGAFFLFLPPGHVHARWYSGVRRDAIERKCRLAAILLDRQRLHEDLSRQTHFDDLTGLPNRREFERHLVETMQRCGASGDSFSILILDIDRFQRINEVRGYEAADRLLVEIAERLRPNCRAKDLLARVAGDEFALLIPDALEPDALRLLAVRLLEAFQKPFDILGKRLLVSASAGIARFPHDGHSVRRLLASCEIALTEARRERGARIAFFHPALGRQTIEGEEIEHYLAEALRSNRFELFYQPLFQVRGPLSGFEALIRLRTAGDRLINPGVFLPTAEEAGLIVPIGQWVLEAACRQMREWLHTGFGPRRVAINVSAQQLAHHSFVDFVRDMLRRHRIDPGLLEFELTESSLMSDLSASGARLEQIKSLGIHISIDDFGTGYSSLSYLHELPIDKVKIDQSFVQRIHSRNSSLPVIEAIIALSGSLGASVLAEGVETPAQYRALESRGCQEVQGFLFSRPLGAGALGEFANGVGRHSSDWFARHGPPAYSLADASQ
jgi:diguanylate cyclase (GGDEF)-like protein